MAENIVSLDEFNNLFADFVSSVLNMPQDKVLISYQTEGQKFSKINETVCYVHVSQEQDEVQLVKNRKSVYNHTTHQWVFAQSAMRRLSIRFTFYGPQSDVLATKLKELMYFDSTKQFLYKNNLSIIPSKILITNTIHEKINERFWERVDLEVGMYNSTTVEEITGAVEELDLHLVPNIMNQED